MRRRRTAARLWRFDTEPRAVPPALLGETIDVRFAVASVLALGGIAAVVLTRR